MVVIDILLIVEGILLGILLGIEIVTMIENIMNIFEELEVVRMMDTGTGTVVGATPEETKAMRLEEIREKIIKFIEKEFATDEYKYSEKESNEHSFIFIKQTDKLLVHKICLYFNEITKGYSFSDEQTDCVLTINIELHDLITEYMKELGWL